MFHTQKIFFFPLQFSIPNIIGKVFLIGATVKQSTKKKKKKEIIFHTSLLEENIWKNDAWFLFALEYGERHCLELGAWNNFYSPPLY